MPGVYYNENDGPTADWLERLVRDNLIAHADAARQSRQAQRRRPSPSGGMRRVFGRMREHCLQ